MDLFDAVTTGQLVGDRGTPVSARPGAPLAVRMRPASLDEVAGQEHLLVAGSPLRRLVEPADEASRRAAPGSVILWGPPGTGKTTLAYLVATVSGRRFVELSAVTAGVKDVRQVVEDARRRLATGGEETVLFIDEVHRFSKSQQDALLPSVENRWVTLVAATTENPSFSVNSPLLSRSLLLTLKPLTSDDVRALVRRAVVDERGAGGQARLQVRVGARPEVEVTAHDHRRRPLPGPQTGDDRAEQVPALRPRDLALRVGQVGGADREGRGRPLIGGRDVEAQPRPLLGVVRVLGRVDAAVAGRPGHRRPAGDDAEPVQPAVAAAVGRAGPPVAVRLEGGHGRAAGHDAGERPLQDRHVVLAHLVEGHEIGHLGADHRDGLRGRPARVAARDAAVAQVHLQHAERDGRGRRGHRDRRDRGRRHGLRSGRASGEAGGETPQQPGHRPPSHPWQRIRRPDRDLPRRAERRYGGRLGTVGGGGCAGSRC
jgi:hypothetical protein